MKAKTKLILNKQSLILLNGKIYSDKPLDPSNKPLDPSKAFGCTYTCNVYACY